MNSNLMMSGSLYKSIRTPFGRIILTTDKGEGTTTNLFPTNLFISHKRDGIVIDERDLGSGIITTAGVNFMAADWTNSTATIQLINFHDSGTGTTAASTSNTVLSSPTGIARVSGTQSNINNVYTTIGVITYNASYSISEWGLFTASSGGTLWDRRTFNAISVINNDQLTFSYHLTIQSGG